MAAMLDDNTKGSSISFGWLWIGCRPPTGDLHFRHVGGQNKLKFAHIVCIKIAVNSQRRKVLLFLSTNMAAMTSNAILQYAGDSVMHSTGT